MRAITAALIVLSLAAPVAAQDVSRSSQQSTGVDVDRLPIDIARIGRELKQSRDEATREGLHLRYRVQIYGAAPPIELFTKEDNLVNGPVPYGAPTHQEILNHITPLPFRTPIMDFSALLRWLQERNKK